MGRWRRSEGIRVIYELFSHRRKRAEQSGMTDVFQYTSVPGKLRVQVQQILHDAIGPQYEVPAYAVSMPAQNAEAWNTIHDTLCRELGCHRLIDKHYNIAMDGVLNYLGTADSEGFVDGLEVCCRIIELAIGKWNEYARVQLGIKQDPSEALTEINYRMRQSGFGFSYTDGQIVRVDSEYSHEEVVKPALRLLNTNDFAGAQQEFLQAHQHYRAGEYTQSITEAAKAFESTLKAVCDKKKWPYEKGARASDLLKRIRTEGLWPDFLDASFDQLLATLSSGLPKVRNEQGAHGQGSAVRKVPDYVAAYALHLAAAKIRLIVEAAQERR